MCVLGSLACLLVSGCAAVTSMRACTQTAPAGVTGPGRLDEPLADPRGELARLRLIAAGADPVTAHAALERILEWHRVALRAAGRSVDAREQALTRLREDERRLLSPEGDVEPVALLAVAAVDSAIYTYEPEITRDALEAWLDERARRVLEDGRFDSDPDERALARLAPFFASLPIDLYAQVYAARVATDDTRFDAAAIAALPIRHRPVLLAVAQLRLDTRDHRSALAIASRLIALDTWDMEARILRVALAHAGDGPLPREAAGVYGYGDATLLRVALDLKGARLAPEAQPSERLALAVRLMQSERPDTALAVVDAVADRGDDANAVRAFVRGWTKPGGLDESFKRACSHIEIEAISRGFARCHVTDVAPPRVALAPEAARTSAHGEEALANATRARIERLLADGELDAAQAMLEREGIALPMVARVGTWLALRDAREHIVATAVAEPWAWERPDPMGRYAPLPTAASLADALRYAGSQPSWDTDPRAGDAQRPPRARSRADRYDRALRDHDAADPDTLVELAAELTGDEAAFVTTQALHAAMRRGDRRLARTLAERTSALRTSSVYPLLGRLALANLDDTRTGFTAARRALERVLPGGFEALLGDPDPVPSTPTAPVRSPAVRCDEGPLAAAVSDARARLTALVRRGRYAESVTLLRQALDTPCAEVVLDDLPPLRAMLPELGDAALVLLGAGLDWTFVTRDSASEVWRSVALEDFRDGHLDRTTAADVIGAVSATDGYEFRALRARFPESQALMLGALAHAADEPDLAHGGSLACGTAAACHALALRVLARDAGDSANVAYAARVLGALGETDEACGRLAQALVAHAEDPLLLEAQAIVCEDPSAATTQP